MKAIVSTSANPFHFGHLDIFNKAKQIFNDVHVVIAQNSNKANTQNLEFHLNAYNIPYVIINDKTVADYCAENKITHIVRGIRNGVDAEYELKLDFANKEINPDIQTVFIPTSDVYSNISSSTIRELLKYKKYDIVKKYMNEDAMWRYIYEKPEYTVYFGKSCVGKSTYLNKFKQYSCKYVDCDKLIWTALEQYTDKETIEEYKEEAKRVVYSNWSIFDKKHQLGNWFDVVLTEQFWKYFFILVNNSFVESDISYNIILDWAAIGFYYKYIPMQYRSKMEFIELTCDEEVRNKRIIQKGFEDKIKFLDNLYEKPLIIDKTFDITTKNEYK